jgi:hypothetical protein
MSSMATLFVGGQSFLGSAYLDRPANGLFDMARRDVRPEEIKAGMTARLEFQSIGTHTIQITRRDGPRVHFKVLT